MLVYIKDTKDKELSKWLSENNIPFTISSKDGEGLNINTKTANQLFELGIKYGKYRQQVRQSRKETNYKP